MSMLLFHDPRDYHPRPSRIINQHFGGGLNPEDFLAPLQVLPSEMGSLLHPLRQLGLGEYYRPWRAPSSSADIGSTVSLDHDKFQAHLDVQQFKPEEITVNCKENVVTIEGKHEEKEDEHGYVFRHFKRRYVLPKGHDFNKVESRLSSDGVLTITAPKISSSVEEHRHVPITHTGRPHQPHAVKSKEVHQEIKK